MVTDEGRLAAALEALAAAMVVLGETMTTFAEGASGLRAEVASLRGAMRANADDARLELRSRLEAAVERRTRAEEAAAVVRERIADARGRKG